MKNYVLNFGNLGGHIEIETNGLGGTIAIGWTCFDEVIERAKANGMEYPIAKNQAAKLKEFFAWVKDSEGENYPNIMELLQKRDPGLYALIEGL